MAKAKRTPITHQSKLDFPQDVFGITLNMKREGARTIGRMAGKDDRLKVVLGTLDVLRQYATDKLQKQKDDNVRAAERRLSERELKERRELGSKEMQAKTARAAAEVSLAKAEQFDKEAAIIKAHRA